MKSKIFISIILLLVFACLGVAAYVFFLDKPLTKPALSLDASGADINDTVKSSDTAQITPSASTEVLPSPSPSPSPSPTPEPEPVDPYENAVIVPYEGYVEHIFFHPLVAYPERAFDGEASAKGMDDYMATTKECRRLLEEAYKNNYVLVDINSVYDKVTGEDGTERVERMYFDFPEGKKPLVISMDDLNYYPYMIKDGCNFKMILDENGKIANYSEDMNGNPVVTYDTEVVTIVEEFVKEHPDFSFKGARGVLGVTGFEGVLGYRTQEGSPNRESEIEAAKPVIAKLKEMGWTFASHSYGHPHMSKLSFEAIKADTDDWKREVEPLIGPTRVFLYPYGDFIKHDDAGMDKLNYLIDVGGFNIHCGVSVLPYAKTFDRYAFEDRKNIDGLTLRNRRDKVADLFDTEVVIDREARGW